MSRTQPVLLPEKLWGNSRGSSLNSFFGSRCAGFTLIELLVVIVIVAVMTTFVTVNLNIRNVGKAVRDESLRLGLLMQIASDQAIYSRAQFGIRFHPESYEFYQLIAGEDNSQATWQPVEDARLAMRPPKIETEFQVDIEGIPIILETLAEEQEGLDLPDAEPLKPHVLFLSNGEVMPEYKVVVADKEEGQYRHQVFSGEEEPIVVEALE